MGLSKSRVKNAIGFFVSAKWNMIRRGHYSHAKSGVFALILTALGAQFYFVARLFRASPKPDYVALHESRLASAKQALPKRGLIGYIGIEESPIVGYIGIEEGATVHVNEHYLTQYALAPLVLVFNSTKPALVLANFHDIPNRTELSANRQLEMKEDFGNGVMLLQRKR